MARDTIWVGENSILHYPSSIGLIPDTLLQNSKLIRLNEGVRIEGVIADLTTSADPEVDLCTIKIGKTSQIIGQVFTRNSMEMRGNISGQIITGKFQLPTASSLYINHLLDVGINITTLPQDFIGCEFLQIDKPKKIVKWLH
ncbi:MAG: hypothetical protein U5Q03_18085 [Bacteroidota bacterium]|nr:hypothetical protein [Bacteroidota bacterium]